MLKPKQIFMAFEALEGIWEMFAKTPSSCLMIIEKQFYRLFTIFKRVVSYLFISLVEMLISFIACASSVSSSSNDLHYQAKLFIDHYHNLTYTNST